MFDPYKILGVRKAAKPAQVRKAYLLLAKKLHPDTGKDTADPEAFAQATKAYELLMDAGARKKFDKFGIVGGEPGAQRMESAIATLKRLFAQIVAQVPLEKMESFDLLGELNRQITQQRSKFNDEQREAGKRLNHGKRTLEIMAKRLRKNKGAPDMLIDALNESMAPFVMQAQALEENIAVGDLMLNLLKDFSYDFDAMDTQYAATFSHSHQTFTIRVG